MTKNFRTKLLTESSTSDGATLYMVLEPIGPGATLDDVLVEIQNEQHLYNMVMGMRDQREMSKTKLFVNKAAAVQLAELRVSQSELGGSEVWDDPDGDAGAVDLTRNSEGPKPPFDGGVVDQTRN